MLCSQHEVLATDGSCGLFGSSDESQVTVRRDQMFYLNIDNPAPCAGNVTSWRVCYYGPDNVGFSTYWATYAVYRRINSQYYERVSEMYRAVRATGLISAIDSTGTVDGEVQEGGFSCYNDIIDAGDPYLIVEAGDILGACVFEPADASTFTRHQLDVVGRTPGQPLYGMGTAECTTDTIPFSIPVSQLTPIASRRLHLYANIGKYIHLTSDL